MKKTRRHTKRARLQTKKGGRFTRPVYLQTNYENNYFENYIKSGPISGLNKNIEKRLVGAIKKSYNVPEKQIPVGTIIYRTAFEVDPRDFWKSDILFFGLDVWIAIWYGLELWQRIKKDRYSLSYDRWYVHMHEYKVIKSIEYTYIPDININPKDEPYKEICEKQPCIHPQKIFHGNTQAFMDEIGTELTIPYSFPILEHLKPERTFKVDIIRLLEMQNMYSYMLNEKKSWKNILQEI